MPVGKSPGRHLHEAIVEILTEAAAASQIAVEGRDVTVVSHVPDDTFSQKTLPLIGVERPQRTEVSPWDGSYERQVFTVPILIVDACRVGPDDLADAVERLDRLYDAVRVALSAEPNLRLAFLHAYYSACEWAQSEDAFAGNNLLARPLSLTVPLIVERGVVWES